MTHRTSTRVRAWIVVALCASGAIGLAQAPQPPSRPLSSFRLATTVVEVDAVVTDRAGRFVDSLTADDFEVLDEGVPQKIQALFRVDGTTVRVVSSPGAAVAEGGGAAPPPDPARPAVTRAPQRVFILFFDQEHLDQGSFTRLRSSALQFLKTRFQEGDVGGVLMGATMVGNRLTADRQALVAAVAGATLNPGATMVRSDLRDYPRMSQVEAIRIALHNDTRILDQVADRAAREGPEGGRQGAIDMRPMIMEKSRLIVSQLQQSTAVTIRAMAGLLNGLARVPGRKTVLFMTEGFLFEQAWGDLRALVGQAARSDVRIYTIDALGMRRRETSTDLSVMNPLETGGQVPTEAYNTIEEGPNTLANDTGGYVVRNTNDFGGAMAEIVRDASSYYVIGFSPPESALTGKFRRLTVRVTRDGLQVRARRGYLAAAANGATPPKAPEPLREGRGDPAAAPPGAGPPPSPAGSGPPPVPPADAAGGGDAGAALSPPLPASAVPLRPDAKTRVRDLASHGAAAGEAKTLGTKGWERYAAGDIEGAAVLLGQAAAQKGAAPWISYALGLSQLGLGKPDLAAQSFERVRAAVPAFESVYFDLTDACIQMGDPGRAVDLLRVAEQRWPADTDVLNALGTVQVRRGATDDAIGTFERAIARNGKDSLAYFNVARTYELRYYQLRRFSRPDARWMDDPELLGKAVDAYESYLKLGGPYEADARASRERLRWVK